jgi:hypothetical protein
MKKGYITQPNISCQLPFPRPLQVTTSIVQNESKVRTKTLDDGAVYRFSLSSKGVKMKSQLFIQFPSHSLKTREKRVAQHLPASSHTHTHIHARARARTHTQTDKSSDLGRRIKTDRAHTSAFNSRKPTLPVPVAKQLYLCAYFPGLLICANCTHFCETAL